MELATPAWVFYIIAYGSRMGVRRIGSLCEGTIGQGIRIGRVWSNMWEGLRAGLMMKEEDEEILEQRQADEETGGKRRIKTETRGQIDIGEQADEL